MGKEFLNILGLKVLAIKGFQHDKRKKTIQAQYIFFDDEKTYCELEEQDYYTYHDCATYARIINTYQDKQSWKNLFNTTVDANDF